ncbi:type II toxin-antitoxin system HicA family toxin [Microlunatus sp. GCM10028923]|uniref:type II toxin-antitoxin system HicA family toxin n=1 Tax=Microlunatus sp. GCM10028923 TaxID=3273400 RepID=UPI00360F634C
MGKELPTRVVIKRLTGAGFVRIRGEGSHSWWRNPDTDVGVSVPDGHRTISPGVVRKIDQAITESERRRREEKT